MDAAAQGQVAGYNAVASLSGKQPKRRALAPRCVTLSAFGLQLTAMGKLKQQGDEEVVIEKTDALCRSVIVRNDLVVGAQLVGTRKHLNEYRKAVSARAPLDSPRRNLTGVPTATDCKPAVEITEEFPYSLEMCHRDASRTRRGIAANSCAEIATTAESGGSQITTRIRRKIRKGT